MIAALIAFLIAYLFARLSSGELWTVFHALRLAAQHPGGVNDRGRIKRCVSRSPLQLDVWGMVP